jgi:uncharacterized protein (DUF58 family)
VRPTRRTLGLVGALVGLGAGAAFWAPLSWAFGGLGLGVAGALVTDALRLRARPALRVVRTAPGSLPVGAWWRVGLRVENESVRSETVEVFDGAPADAELSELPRRVEVPAEAGVELTYRVRMRKRGVARFEACHLMRESPWSLWRAHDLSGSADEVKVYPDFAAVAGYALLALENRVDLMGIRKRPRRGAGLEFHQLREWREGDTLRQVDWKATSRRVQVISREYQEERDQQVLFLLDCGRRMRATDADLTHFDHCLNAMLLLSYIALRQGDAVGLVTFGGRDRWVKPSKGRHTLHTVLNQTFDLDTTLQPPDYLEAARRAATLQPRRALVILLTNQREEDASDLLPALHLLRTRHLVVLASLRERSVDALLDAAVEDLPEAVAHAAARKYAEGRRRAIEGLRGRGMLALDVAPRDLPVALANQYLDLKRAGAL